MRQFKYCVWLKLDENHPLNKKCDFPLHITIKSDLEKEEAIELYKKIDKSILPLEIEIKESQDGYHNQFYAYYLLVDTPNKKNIWWWKDASPIGMQDPRSNASPVGMQDPRSNASPIGMHLSMKYKYGNKKKTLENIRISGKNYEKLIGEKLIFNEICIFHCDDHYKKWYKVDF